VVAAAAQVGTESSLARESAIGGREGPSDAKSGHILPEGGLDSEFDADDLCHAAARQA
jgi:hypothetical protein